MDVAGYIYVATAWIAVTIGWIRGLEVVFFSGILAITTYKLLV